MWALWSSSGSSSKHRVRFHRQVVQRQVRRREVERRLQVLARFGQRLRRQRVHQVEVEIVEGVLRNLDCARCLIAIVDAAQHLQMRRVEALGADRQAVDAAVAIALEALGLEGAGLGSIMSSASSSSGSSVRRSDIKRSNLRPRSGSGCRRYSARAGVRTTS